jgi:hypothetical protein
LVQIRRILPVGVVLGATLALGIWLLTYRVWDVVEYIGRDGRPFHPAEHVRIQPWWSVPATVAVCLLAWGLASGCSRGAEVSFSVLLTTSLPRRRVVAASDRDQTTLESRLRKP